MSSTTVQTNTRDWGAEHYPWCGDGDRCLTNGHPDDLTHHAKLASLTPVLFSHSDMDGTLQPGSCSVSLRQEIRQAPHVIVFVTIGDTDEELPFTPDEARALGALLMEAADKLAGPQWVSSPGAEQVHS